MDGNPMEEDTSGEGNKPTYKESLIRSGNKGRPDEKQVMDDEEVSMTT